MKNVKMKILNINSQSSWPIRTGTRVETGGSSDADCRKVC